jgi:hypothetical protein
LTLKPRGICDIVCVHPSKELASRNTDGLIEARDETCWTSRVDYPESRISFSDLTCDHARRVGRIIVEN